MRKLPVGVQNYSELIENNCVYVDKTFYILKLIQSGASSFFCPGRDVLGNPFYCQR